MTTVIERLAETLPSPLAEGEPAYLEVAHQVCDLVAVGRTMELSRFFSTLETLYAGHLDAKSSNALYEGLMESIVYTVERHGIPPNTLYGQLLPKSRRAWEAAWQYIHESSWPA